MAAQGLLGGTAGGEGYAGARSGAGGGRVGRRLPGSCKQPSPRVPRPLHALLAHPHSGAPRRPTTLPALAAAGWPNPRLPPHDAPRTRCASGWLHALHTPHAGPILLPSSFAAWGAPNVRQVGCIHRAAGARPYRPPVGGRRRVQLHGRPHVGQALAPRPDAATSRSAVVGRGAGTHGCARRCWLRINSRRLTRPLLPTPCAGQSPGAHPMRRSKPCCPPHAPVKALLPTSGWPLHASPPCRTPHAAPTCSTHLAMLSSAALFSEGWKVSRGSAAAKWAVCCRGGWRHDAGRMEGRAAVGSQPAGRTCARRQGSCACLRLPPLPPHAWDEASTCRTPLWCCSNVKRTMHERRSPAVAPDARGPVRTCPMPLATSSTSPAAPPRNSWSTARMGPLFLQVCRHGGGEGLGDCRPDAWCQQWRLSQACKERVPPPPAAIRTVTQPAGCVRKPAAHLSAAAATILAPCPSWVSMERGRLMALKFRRQGGAAAAGCGGSGKRRRGEKTFRCALRCWLQNSAPVAGAAARQRDVQTAAVHWRIGLWQAGDGRLLFECGWIEARSATKARMEARVDAASGIRNPCIAQHAHRCFPIHCRRLTAITAVCTLGLRSAEQTHHLTGLAPRLAPLPPAMLLAQRSGRRLLSHGGAVGAAGALESLWAGRCVQRTGVQQRQGWLFQALRASLRPHMSLRISGSPGAARRRAYPPHRPPPPPLRDRRRVHLASCRVALKAIHNAECPAAWPCCLPQALLRPGVLPL